MIKCQCPMCKEFFEAEQEWIGQEAACPYCQQTIRIQTHIVLDQPTVAPAIDIPLNNEQVEVKRSTASLVLGIIGLITWLLPLIGFPITIVGLILGIQRKYKIGIILNIIALVFTTINSIIGAILGAQGRLF